MTLRRTPFALVSAIAIACLPIAAGAQAPAAPANDLDAFMAQVLERRTENWRTLHDYILSEREGYQILGPGGILLEGLRREFNWFVRDGYLVRSPVKANSAAVSEAERRRYEDRWLAGEERREKRRAAGAAEPDPDQKGADLSPGDLVGKAREPRFISEAYFLKFTFEPGNYYLVGRETLDGRQVLRIEYYPTRMFGDRKARADRKRGPTVAPRKDAGQDRDDQMEDDIERAMNKVTLVTLWVDPVEHQIVKFTFDNPDFGFLPGRALVRVDEARASMTMGVFFGNVWLPRRITFSGAATFAAGTYRFEYSREFYDYRKGEVSATIRGYIPKEPRP